MDMDTNMDTKKEVLIVSGVLLVIIIIGVVIFVPNLLTPAPASTQPVVAVQPAAVAVPIETLAHGVKSTITDRVNYVITSPAEMTKLWKMVDAAEPPPTVDFNKQMVLAVFAGKGTSADITIARVVDADARVVSVTIVPPGPACAQKVKTTAPYEIVAVPATSLPLTHRDVTTTASCQ